MTARGVVARGALLFLLAAAGLLAAPGGASAHPLGNFTVNHFNRLTLHTDRIDLHAVIDLAEIPTVQEQSSIDTDGNGVVSTQEATAAASRQCRRFAAAATVTVDGARGTWRTTTTSLEFPPGEAGLATTRLTCDLTTETDLTDSATVAFEDTFRTDRIGWHELVVTGADARPTGADLPTTSISDELRAYPDDLLADPLDVRAATFETVPGSAVPGSAADMTGQGWFDAAVSSVTGWFTDIAGTRDLTPLVGVLAVLLSLVLGASHAALPGHGKTVIAAYLAGKNGSVRDAVTVGATVTITHTAGVLVLGLLISASSAVAGESVLGWLGVVSGALVAVIGAVLLRSAWRHRVRAGSPELALVAAGAPTAVGHGHAHGHGHGHAHGHGYGRSGLIGMGVAGGLVPSPSALVVLLGAIGLGRTWFGVLLVLGYGIGMAATLTLVGILLVRLRDRLDRLSLFGMRHRLSRLRGLLPVLTATLVLLVGIGLAVRAAAGIT